MLKALMDRDVLEREEAVQRLEQLAETRDWLDASIYCRAKQLFNDE